MVLSIGGSIINPGKIDRAFIRKLRSVLLSASKTHRLGVVFGGGQPCRFYQTAARDLGVHGHDALDWIGIRTTQVNAEFMRFVLGPSASPVIASYHDPLPRHQIVVGAGEKPGSSTDLDTVFLAEKLHAKTIFNLSNIDYVYEKDPAKFRNARILKDVTWREYVQRFPLVRTPGMHAPFDPTAVKRARKNGMIVIVLNGMNITNLTAALAGKPFKGTVIHP
jgi:uridylate kinase